jgi:peptidoglycan-N-acetylglucosamine deacetylase
MYFFSTPYFIKKFFRKNIVWEKDPSENSIYLTFDDGPEASVTPWVLEELKKYDAKATFFCLGKNADANPELLETIMQEGHMLGNHSYSHCNGWDTPTHDYIADVEKCNQIIKSDLFRPPYGKIKLSQLRQLKKKYSIMMWSLMSGDFDSGISREKCLDTILNKTKPGTIIIFHDSLKAKEKLEYVLPRYLQHFKEKGYRFPVLQAKRP